MKIFGRLTCYQCRAVFSSTNHYCPNCGATRRENTGQISARRLRGAGIILVFGALLGLGCALALGFLFPDLPALKFPFLKTGFAMELSGLILGGAIGAVLYTVVVFARE